MIQSMALVAAGVLLALTLLGFSHAGARSSGWCEGFTEGMRIGYGMGYAKGKAAGMKEAHNLPFTDEPELSDEYLAELMGVGG